MYDIIKMSDLIDTKVESRSDDPDYLVTWVAFLVGQVGLICKLNVTRFAKTDIMTNFWKSRFLHQWILYTQSFVLSQYQRCIANTFWVTRLDNKRSNTLALYAFLRWLILHVFNYTYGNFNLQSWDNYHSTPYEMAILGFFENIKANYLIRVV